MNAIGRRLALAEILSSLILHLTPILGPFADMEVCVCVCVCVCVAFRVFGLLCPCVLMSLYMIPPAPRAAFTSALARVLCDQMSLP